MGWSGGSGAQPQPGSMVLPGLCHTWQAGAGRRWLQRATWLWAPLGGQRQQRAVLEQAESALGQTCRVGFCQGCRAPPAPLHPLLGADPWHGHCPGAAAQSQPPKERQEETRAVGQAPLLQLGQDRKPLPEALEYPACFKPLLRAGMPG